MVNDSDHQFTAIVLGVGFATLSLIASLLTLYLIKKTAKWNGYIQLVVSLTACQIIYDLSFFFLPVPFTWGEYIYLFLNTFGGLSSALWSNIIIIVTARIVIRLRTVDTLKRYRTYCVLVMIPSSTVSIAAIAVYSRESYEHNVIVTYFVLRCASIVLNLCAISIIFLKISSMQDQADNIPQVTEQTPTNSGHRKNVLTGANKYEGESVKASDPISDDMPDDDRNEGDGAPSFTPSPTLAPNFHTNPVFILSKRLVYYGIVQTVTRIGSSWYQLAYGFSHEYDESEASTLQTIIYLSEFVLNPSAGIGYLIVFLLIQPEAWIELRKMLGCSVVNKTKHTRQNKRNPHINRNMGASNSISHDYQTSNGWTSYHSSEALYGSQKSLSDFDGEQAMFVNDSDDNLRNTFGTDSTDDSTMFPLLDHMDEDDLAREIERRYNPNYASRNDNKMPLLSNRANI